MDLNRLSKVFSSREQKQEANKQDQLLGEELKCPLCLEISRSPITTDCCGSVFCEPCIKQIKANRCPKCNKQQFTYSSNPFVKRLANQYPTNCKYGCGHLCGGSEIGNHEQQCHLRTSQCKYCSYSGNYNSFIQHIINQHINEMVQLFEKKE